MQLRIYTNVTDSKIIICIKYLGSYINLSEHSISVECEVTAQLQYTTDIYKEKNQVLGFGNSDIILNMTLTVIVAKRHQHLSPQRIKDKDAFYVVLSKNHSTVNYVLTFILQFTNTQAVREYSRRI